MISQCRFVRCTHRGHTALISCQTTGFVGKSLVKVLLLTSSSYSPRNRFVSFMCTMRATLCVSRWRSRILPSCSGRPMERASLPYPLHRPSLAGKEPDVLAFVVPIDFDALNQFGLLELKVDGTPAAVVNIKRSTDQLTLGQCRVRWNTTFSGPGRHTLAAVLRMLGDLNGT